MFDREVVEAVSGQGSEVVVRLSILLPLCRTFVTMSYHVTLSVRFVERTVIRFGIDD